MATLPRFDFPLRSNSDTLHTDSTKAKGREERERERGRPQISLKTCCPREVHSREGKGYTLPVPDLGLGYKRIDAIATPPDSPTRSRSYTMGADGSSSLPNTHGGAMIPPPTPTESFHSQSSSASSIRNSLGSLRRGDSISYRIGSGRTPSIDENEKHGSTEPRRFEFWLSDYEIKVDENGKKRPLGTGAWSKVYLAKPCLPKPQDLVPVAGAEMTPPVTPVRSRNSSLSKATQPQVPPAYAIKLPDGRSAHKVLGEECRVLSYLSRLPDKEKFVVQFYGQDARNDGLVLKLMDGALDDWMQRELNKLPEMDRAAKLAEVFPGIAAHLLDGLAWFEEKGCTHGDIKPGNILISTSPPTSVPHAVYTDFSSATLPALHTSEHKAPVGGATWDFLDPTLLTKATASTPASSTTDLWALAITLLVLVIGQSPYSSVATNDFQKRESIKQGTPLGCMAHGNNGPRNIARMNALSKSLGFDVKAWFARVLTKDASKRVDLAEWRAELQQSIAIGLSKI